MKKPLNSIFDLEWHSRICIEASAGTGKTYTIVGLFIRLLVEKELDIDRILVMTFTKKATSELRDRLLDRIRECRDVLENGYAGDDLFLKEFHSRFSGKKKAAEAVQRAIRDFDENQVTTIHGFCQKVLSEETLMTGTPFDVEVVQHDDLLQEAVEDFWRLFMEEYGGTRAGRYYIGKLLDIAETPAALRREMEPLFSKPYAVLEGEGAEDPTGYLQELLDLRDQMRAVWEAEKEVVRKELTGCDLKYYTEQNVASRVEAMDLFLHEEVPEKETFKQLKHFTKEYHQDEGNLKKNGSRIPAHRFFDLCSLYHEKASGAARVETALIKQAFEHIYKRRNELSSLSEAVTYDDLLIKVDEALRDPGQGQDLAGTLLGKFPYALVDEFQDTDPVQYSIFDRIYSGQNGDSGLLMIGDPKQAIYAFRGADVYTYFRAGKDSRNELYTLKNNYRSSPALIEAVNRLFDGDRVPFLEEDIEFFRSDSGNPDLQNGFLVDENPPVPFSIIAREGVRSNKKEAKAFAFDQTVRRIVALLQQSEEGRVTLEGRRLKAADIAVLVQGHADAEEIRAKLKSAGIDAVTYSRKNVFETFEARRMELMMAAVLEPFNRRAVNRALLSGFFGLSIRELYGIKESEDGRYGLVEELEELQNIWRGDGFYPMFRKLAFSGRRLAEMGRLAHAERVLTNLHQIAEICSKTEKEEEFEPYALHAWVQEKLRDPGSDEEMTLLLESDQNLVKISTIHNSKGLQFPVVFCPQVWEGRKPDMGRFVEYHKPDSGKLAIHIGQANREERNKAETRSLIESVAEEVRKVYVSLTRARYLCTIVWDTHSASHLSGLGSSLIGLQGIRDFIHNHYQGNEKDSGAPSEMLIDKLKELNRTWPDLFSLELPPEEEASLSVTELHSGSRPDLAFRPYRGREDLPVQKKLESFSSLVYHKKDPEEPDHDQLVESYTEALSADLRKEEESPNLFRFPRGATAGTAIHKLFEHETFSFDSAAADDHTAIIREVLENFRFDEKWIPALQGMIRQVAEAEIPGLDLGKVKEKDQLREMEFHFSASGADSGTLFDIIRHRGQRQPPPGNISGFMTGFIDLVVRQNGIYYILDYKSNHLGDRFDHYSRDRLRDEIESAGYDLQYHLYTVALVKYLRKRVPEFRYENHFGGVAYLFVRGMKKYSNTGIWFHKPRKETIERLEQQLSVRS